MKFDKTHLFWPITKDATTIQERPLLARVRCTEVFLPTLDSIAMQHLYSLIMIMRLFIFRRICFIIIPPNFHWWRDDLILTSGVVCYLIVELLSFNTWQKEL